MVSIYLAEDQGLLNTALNQLLNLEDDLTVIGTANNGQKALDEVIKLKPDVAILDIEMPSLTGLEVAKCLREKECTTKVIILTTFAQKAYFEQAVEAHVSGYLLKDSDSDELVGTIRQVMKGRIVYAPELVTSVLTMDKNQLSNREMEVLKAVVSGASTKQIAQQLFLSEGTVRNYLSAIFSKLGVHNRLEAIRVARNKKWIN